jgi:hypothetical protein
MKFADWETATPLVLAVLMSSISPGVLASEILPASIPKTGASPEQFCPLGWKIESKLTADLHGNGAKDQILQLIGKKPGKNSNGVSTDVRCGESGSHQQH